MKNKTMKELRKMSSHRSAAKATEPLPINVLPMLKAPKLAEHLEAKRTHKSLLVAQA
jgi:hypothetical protein